MNIKLFILLALVFGLGWMGITYNSLLCGIGAVLSFFSLLDEL